MPEIFNEIQRVGSVADAEMERVFNLGVGMVLVVERGREESIVACLARAGHEAAIIGALEPGEKDVIYR